MSSEGPVNRRASLRSLPFPTDITGDPWTLRTTKQVAELLGVDPACFTVWRYRGIGPAPEPNWFKGSAQISVDRVQSWLAARQGLPYDQEQAWAEALYAANGQPVREQVQAAVKMLGPDWAAPEGCRWRWGAFEQYLASLSADQPTPRVAQRWLPSSAPRLRL